MSPSTGHAPTWTLIFSPQQLLSLLAAGATTKQLAEQLRVKEYWVEEALAACRAYFGVTTRSELVAIATKTTARRRSAALPHLSAREREIVALVATGVADKQIARELGIAIGTVRTHLDRMKKKTGLRRRAEIASAYASAAHDHRLAVPRTWEPYLEARHRWLRGTVASETPVRTNRLPPQFVLANDIRFIRERAG